MRMIFVLVLILLTEAQSRSQTLGPTITTTMNMSITNTWEMEPVLRLTPSGRFLPRTGWSKVFHWEAPTHHKFHQRLLLLSHSETKKWFVLPGMSDFILETKTNMTSCNLSGSQFAWRDPVISNADTFESAIEQMENIGRTNGMDSASLRGKVVQMHTYFKLDFFLLTPDYSHESAVTIDEIRLEHGLLVLKFTGPSGNCKAEVWLDNEHGKLVKATENGRAVSLEGR